MVLFPHRQERAPIMNKAQKIANAAAMVEGITAELVVEAANPEVIAKAKVGKAAQAVKAEKAPAAPKAEKPAKVQSVLSAKEVAVMAVIQGSDFADPESKAVPSYVIALEVKGVEPKSVPGIVASLNKKGMLVGSKVKGLYMVALSAFGLDAYAAEAA